jgi:hypothetical protein
MTKTRTIAVGLGLSLGLLGLGRESLAQAPVPPGGGVSAGMEGGGGVAGTVGTPGGVNVVLIVLAPAVQQELKLTDAQKNQVYELSRDAGRKSRDLWQSVFQAGGANPQALMLAGSRMRQENDRAVSQILQPDQKERANQIVLRVEGPLAVARPEIASKLGLSPAQTQQIQATLFQMMQAQREFVMASAANANQTGIPDPRQGAMARARMNQLRESAGQQIGRILNSKQKAAFNKLLGEPFDITKIDPDLPRPAAAAAASPNDNRATEPDKARTPRKKGAALKKPAAAKDGGDQGTPKS